MRELKETYENYSIQKTTTTTRTEQITKQMQKTVLWPNETITRKIMERLII